MLQVRALSTDNTQIPQWSEPVHLNITNLPAPELTTAKLVSTSLEVESSGYNISATINMNWERPANHKNLDVLEAWVGSRSLGEFEEPDLFQRTITVFEVKVAKHKIHVVGLFLIGYGLVEYWRIGRLFMLRISMSTHLLAWASKSKTFEDTKLSK